MTWTVWLPRQPSDSYLLLSFRTPPPEWCRLLVWQCACGRRGIMSLSQFPTPQLCKPGALQYQQQPDAPAAFRYQRRFRLIHSELTTAAAGLYSMCHTESFTQDSAEISPAPAHYDSLPCCSHLHLAGLPLCSQHKTLGDAANADRTVCRTVIPVFLSYPRAIDQQVLTNVSLLQPVTVI